MSLQRTAWCAVLAGGAVLVSACSTGGSANAVTPVVPTPTPTSTASATPTPAPTLSPLSSCTQPNITVPGAYTTFFTLGNFAPAGGNPGVFTSSAATSLYTRDNYVLPTPTPAPTPTAPPTGVPTPTPTPSSAPTPTPTPVAYNIFNGTYHLAFAGGLNPTDGCVLILTTQNGSPIFGGGADNADTIGSLNTTLVKSTNVSTGLATVSVTTLAGGTGTGTISLTDGETGTITITSMTTATFSADRKALERRR